MENKYLPEEIHSLTSALFFLKEEAKISKGGIFGGKVPSHEFRIFIKLRSDDKKCFLIFSKENGPVELALGTCTGSIWRIQQDDSELFKHRENLGKVLVQRSLVTIKEYPDYDSLWNEIKQI